MRCYCCNERLTEYEATRRNATTNEFIDMCNTCYATIKDDLLTIEREDLLTNEAEEISRQADTESYNLYSFQRAGVDSDLV